MALADEPLQHISFHPKFAEPGELVTSLFLDLNVFLSDSRNLGLCDGSSLNFSELSDHPFAVSAAKVDETASNATEEEEPTQPSTRYRMYFMNCALTAKQKRSSVRATLLLAREKDWAWCETRQFLELDSFDNPILCARKTDGSSGLGQVASLDDEEQYGLKLPQPERRDFSWRVATRFYTPGLGLRDLTVVVCVANGIDLSRSEAEFGRMDMAHTFSVRLMRLHTRQLFWDDLTICRYSFGANTLFRSF